MRIAEKLRRMAASMEHAIADKLRPMTQNWTPKRGREYAARVHDGHDLQRAHVAMLALAAAHERGDCPPALVAVATKKAICAMTRTLSDNSGGYYSHRETGEPADMSPTAVALRALVATQGAALDEAIIRRETDLRESLDRLRRLDIPGFFPTPPVLARRVVELADIADDHRVLEPSAGIGSLADACPNRANIDCYEINSAVAEACGNRGYAVVCRDFLDERPIPIYERVVMNPPFERSADATHVRHAFRFLKPGGRLVALVSAGTLSCDRGQWFRDWLDRLSASVTRVGAGAFTGAEAFRATGVDCSIVVINKPPHCYCRQLVESECDFCGGLRCLAS